MVLLINIRASLQELKVHSLKVVQTGVMESCSSLVVNNIVIDASTEHLLYQLFSVLGVGLATFLGQGVEQILAIAIYLFDELVILHLREEGFH